MIDLEETAKALYLAAETGEDSAAPDWDSLNPKYQKHYRQMAQGVLPLVAEAGDQAEAATAKRTFDRYKSLAVRYDRTVRRLHLLSDVVSLLLSFEDEPHDGTYERHMPMVWKLLRDVASTSKEVEDVEHGS